MTQCPNGHIYDESKNESCPICDSLRLTSGVTMKICPKGHAYDMTQNECPICRQSTPAPVCMAVVRSFEPQKSETLIHINK